MDPQGERWNWKTGPWALGAWGTLVALAVVLPGLTEHGIWSSSELPAVNRARAALGEPLADLIRSPWLLDWVRTRALAAAGVLEAVRIPGALAICGVVGLATGFARALRLPIWTAALAGALALSMPGLQSAGRLAHGNAVGELLAGIGVIAGLSAVAGIGWRRLAAGIVSLTALGLAVAACGLFLGGFLPVSAIALAAPGRHRVPRALVGVTATLLAAACGYLMYHQGDGYLPILAAARDLNLVARPEARSFAATLGDWGYQSFPWLPIAAIGLLRPKSAAPAASWLLVGLAACSLWSAIYGEIALPLTVPTAIVGAAGLRAIVAADAPLGGRRFLVLVAVAGFLVMGKDGQRTPSRIGAPLGGKPGEHMFAAEESGAGEQIPGFAKLAALGVLLAAMAAPRPVDDRRRPPTSGRFAAVRGRIREQIDRFAPASARCVAAAAVLLVVVTRQGVVYARVLIPALSAHESPKIPLQRHQSWAAAGTLPATLGIGQLRDPALPLYGVDKAARVELKGRVRVAEWLARDEPSVALTRDTELAYLHQIHREAGWPLYLLDGSNKSLVLVSNTLPAGASDQSPLPAIVSDAPPALAHETLLRFEDKVEVVGWQITEPVVRGAEVTVELALHVIGRMPTQTEIYARLQRGKLSRVHPAADKPTGGLYPASSWREGDYILHRVTFKVPALEVVVGAHELVVGIKQSKTKNLAISVP
ncbi:MAG: hypothetical protein KC636_33500, partial [Myxococcales bacterium]|nr:hypothetical protein [Myxococcales bacterium]